jgi:pyrroline-5-carboxylate reductase
MIKKNIGFIGAGKMAEALINGIINSSLTSAHNIFASDKDSSRMNYITGEYGINGVRTNAALAEKSDIIILAVKPDNIGEVLDEIKKSIDVKKLIISIAAGIKEEFIRQRLSSGTRIVRVMPNTPALVLQGAAGIYFNKNCNKKHREYAKKIFDSIGISIVLDKEPLLDAVTALSGSGPAYVFYFIEALSDAGVSMGLSRDMSQKLAIQTVFGAGKMAKETNIHPTILKEMVTSPGGTTIKALEILERAGIKGSIIKAVNKACKKSKELSKS